MDIQQIPLFSLLSNRMSWLSSRQSVLAENVYNADTPNYIARDLRPLDFAGILRDQEFALKPAATSPNHINSTNVKKPNKSVSARRATITRQRPKTDFTPYYPPRCGLRARIRPR